ncbi:MAG TPA: S24/S26 family peptidase [Candidatus Mediterraneibacter stercoripullorum]|nr:S24/S26 family peptidase [Candidatus Mediterraneibacter stercoripullorum]
MTQDDLPVKTVDTQIFLDAVKEMVRSGSDVPVTITGNSMSPFLVHGRDRILLSRITRPLRKGDMVLYQRTGGQYVMHRIRRINRSRDEYYMIGDAQNVTEGPLKEGQIAAVVTSVCRKGKWMKQGDFWWEFFRRLWLNIVPFRRPVLRVYVLVMRISSGKIWKTGREKEKRNKEKEE